MLIRKITDKENIVENMQKIEAVMLLQFGIDLRNEPHSDDLEDIINICDKKLSEIIKQGIFFGYQTPANETSILKNSSILSIYSTVCSLLDQETVSPDSIRKEFIKSKTSIDSANHTYACMGNNSRNSSKSKQMWDKNEKSYIFRSIVPKEHYDIANRKKLYSFARHSSMLLMWEENNFNITEIIKKISKIKKPKELFDFISEYVYTVSQQIKKNFGINGEELEINLNNGMFKEDEYSAYINSITSLETITCERFIQDALLMLLLIIYKKYNLTDYIIDSFVHALSIPGVHYRSYWLCCATSAITNPRSFEYESDNPSDNVPYDGFVYLNNIKDSLSGMKRIHNEYIDRANLYMDWQRDTRTLITLLSEMLIPIYENSLFFLIYKSCKKNAKEKDNINEILKLMQSQINSYLKKNIDLANFEDYYFYLYDNKVCFYSRDIPNLNDYTRRSSGKEIKKLKYYDILNEQSNYIDWKDNKDNFELIKKFLKKCFNYMDKMQTINSSFEYYNLTYDSFSTNTDFSDESKFSNFKRKYWGEIMSSFLQYNIHTAEYKLY